jgi:hypothetical protein
MTFEFNVFAFIPYIPSHLVALASTPFALLVVSYRLFMGPSERLLAFSFFVLHLILGVFQGLGGVWSISRAKLSVTEWQE